DSATLPTSLIPDSYPLRGAHRRAMRSHAPSQRTSLVLLSAAPSGGWLRFHLSGLSRPTGEAGRPGRGSAAGPSAASLPRLLLRFCGSRVPHLHGPVRAARGETLAIRSERHAGDLVDVPLEGEGLLPRLGVPHLYCLIPTCRGDALTV